MLKNLLKKRNESGFTIIEVMIVLAIAGLILVVVLIAVPQLQRNQRNSARQTDAGRVGTAVSNWSANNNGQTITNDAGDLGEVLNDLGDTSQYELTTGSGSGSSAVPANISVDTGTTSAVSDINEIVISTGSKCDGGAATATGASSRQFVILYATETNNGTPQGQCLEV